MVAAIAAMLVLFQLLLALVSFPVPVRGGWLSCPQTRSLKRFEIEGELLKGHKIKSDRCDLVPVIGQHIAVGALSSALSGFNEKYQPSKPLVLFLFGPPGVGKTFITNRLKEIVYRPALVTYLASVDNTWSVINCRNFARHPVDAIVQRIAKQLQRCEKTTFIIEEPQLLDEDALAELTVFLDSSQPFNVANMEKPIYSRKATFIFATNAGGRLIKDKTMKLLATKAMEDLSYDDFKPILQKLTKRGISTTLDRFIDHYIPALPMTQAAVEELVHFLFKELECRHHVTLEVDPSVFVQFLVAHMALDEAYNDVFTEEGLSGVRAAFETGIETYIKNTIEKDQSRTNTYSVYFDEAKQHAAIKCLTCKHTSARGDDDAPKNARTTTEQGRDL